MTLSANITEGIKALRQVIVWIKMNNDFYLLCSDVAAAICKVFNHFVC